MTQTYKAAVIGSGSGGLTLAIGLSRLGHDIALVESGKVGGDCTNVGCIPSKALLHAAAAGIDDPLGFARAKRDELNERETEEMDDDERIDLIRGHGRLTGHSEPRVVEVIGADGTISQVAAEHVIICTGSRPVEFSIDGLEPDRLLTNETVFDLAEIPAKIVLVGGGAISLEMATAFRDLGSEVEIVELQDRLLGTDDPLVSTTITEALRARGVVVHTGTSVERADGSTLYLSSGSVIVAVDKVLLAVGRRPRIDDLGLADAGVDTHDRGITVDSWGRTNVDNIWAVGDVTGATLTTHGANAVGRRAIRAIALPIPNVGAPRAQANAIYSRPEVASVGLTVHEVNALPAAGRKRYVQYLADVDRGFTDDLEHGVMVVDAERFTGKILRASVVGPGASEMIGIFTIAIDHGIGLRKIFGQVHPYPAYAQAIGQIADEFALDTLRSIPTEWWAMARARATRWVRRR